MNKGFGVAIRPVDESPDEGSRMALAVVAEDELDAQMVAARVAGESADAEVLRELTEDEVLQHGLDLDEHGSAKTVAVPEL